MWTIRSFLTVSLRRQYPPTVPGARKIYSSIPKSDTSSWQNRSLPVIIAASAVCSRSCCASLIVSCSLCSLLEYPKATRLWLFTRDVSPRFFGPRLISHDAFRSWKRHPSIRQVGEALQRTHLASYLLVRACVRLFFL